MEEYRQSLTKLMENSNTIDELTVEMNESADAIMQGSNMMKAAMLADQQRFESESNATVDEPSA